MADTHNLAIFRGALKFKTNKDKIRGVLILLSVITAIEVVLGIYKPEVLMGYIAGMKILNWIFIILTVVKAYYIAWDFMHLRDEATGLRRAIVWTGIFLISYLTFILLTEGGYIENVYSSGYITHDF